MPLRRAGKSCGFSESAVERNSHSLSVRRAKAVLPHLKKRDWTMLPPLGKRSLGGGQAFDPDFWSSVPGGYRNTINDNVVLIRMIETLDGALAAMPAVPRSYFSK